ncbi:MAG: ABC transporter ATP-binding protein [Clostridia bacterium]|nr:ABC transporter ATP-binding protein [Clostridia bacterium]
MLLGKHLNKYYVRYLWMYLLGILALVVIDLAQLKTPQYLGEIVNLLNVKDGPIDTNRIYEICLYILLIAGIMFVGRMLWRFTLFNASQRIEAGLRRDMFQKSERLSQRYYHETKVGSIMSWFTTDLETIEEYTGFGTVQIVDSSFLGIMVIIQMIRLDWVLTLFAAFPMILIIIWGALVEKYMAIKWEARQTQFDRLYDFSQENFTGIRVIKAFVKETSEIHAFAKEAKKSRDTNLDVAKVDILFDNVIELLIAAIMAFILGFGSWFVYSFVSGNPIVLLGHTVELDAGQLITFTGLFDTLIWPLIALGSIIMMHSRSKTSLKRISAFLDQEEEVSSPADSVVLQDISGEITFNHFSFAYPGHEGKPVLSDVSLTIHPGETVGVVGRIGSGKTTLVNILMRLYNIEPGTVFVDGTDIMSCDLRSLRAAIAYVPQDNFLFSNKVSQNISFSDIHMSQEDIEKAAVFADVDENIQDFPDKYETMIGERGVTLSGGQKQRISLARAYAKNAPILILDDSVSAVDVKTEETILRNIREQRKGKTTIVVASRVSTVSNMSRVLVLNEGRVEAFDTPEALAESSPTYQKMVYLQTLESEVEGGDLHE